MLKIIAAAVIVVVLNSCGGSDTADTSPNTALPPAESVRTEERQTGAIGVGELADTGYGARVGVMGFAVGGDDAGPWLETDIRVEAVEEGAAVPTMGIVCGGNTELGGWQAGSTIEQAAAVPTGSFDEGTVNLLLPGDGRYGEPIPACEGPAFVQIDALDGPLSVEIPGDVLDELVAAADAFNATLG